MATLNANASGTDISAALNIDQLLLRSMNRRDGKVKFLTLFAAHPTNSYATFRKFGESSGYQVPNGKVFIALAVKGRVGYTGAGNTVINTADSDISFSSASSGTNPDYGSGTAGYMVNTVSGSGTIDLERSMFMRVPAGRYIQTYTASTSAQVTLYGYEIDPNIENLEELA